MGKQPCSLISPIFVPFLGKKTSFSLFLYAKMPFFAAFLNVECLSFFDK